MLRNLIAQFVKHEYTQYGEHKNYTAVFLLFGFLKSLFLVLEEVGRTEFKENNLTLSLQLSFPNVLCGEGRWGGGGAGPSSLELLI